MARRNRWLVALAAGGLWVGAAQAAPAPKTLQAKTLQTKALQTKALDARAPLDARARFAAPELSHRVEGFTRLRQGDRAGALTAFESAVQADPRDPALWRMVGDLRFTLDQPDAAMSAWREGLQQAGDDRLLLERVLRGSVEQGDYATAAEAADRLVGVMDRYAGAEDRVRTLMAYQSELATLAGDFTTAEQVARDLIKRAPETLDGRLALAYVHLQAQELDDAEDLYREVLAADPGQPVALNNLGNIHYLRRDLDAAAEHFEAILDAPEAGPYNESIALSNLAELLQLQGVYRGAEDLYQASIKARPDGAWGYMGLAALRDITGRYDEAVDAMIDGWERDQNRLTRLNMHFYEPEWAWQRDALIAEIEGDAARAEQLWKQVLHGEVTILHKAAAWHLAALASE